MEELDIWIGLEDTLEFGSNVDKAPEIQGLQENITQGMCSQLQPITTNYDGLFFMFEEARYCCSTKVECRVEKSVQFGVQPPCTDSQSAVS